MKQRIIARWIVCLMLVFFVHAKGFSDVLDPEEIRAEYNSWPEEDKAMFENVIMPTIQQAFGDVVYNAETGAERSILGKRVAFYQLYRTLTEELSRQDEAPFRSYDHFSKMSRSTLRLIMQAMASDSESIFYGIHDDVYDDLYADEEGALPGFQQLTYEPLLSEVEQVPFAIPLAVIATVLVARALPDRRARMAALAVAGIVTIFSSTGCHGFVVSTNWRTQSYRRVQEITRSFIRISYWWKYIEDQYEGYQSYLFEGIWDYFKELYEGTDEPISYNLSVQRQLFAAIYATVTGYMSGYGVDHESHANVWDAFKSNVNTFLTDEALKRAINSDNPHIIDHTIDYLLWKNRSFRMYTDLISNTLVKIEYETVFVLYANWSESQDRRDLHAQLQYLRALHTWIAEASPDENATEWPNVAEIPRYFILSDAERSVIMHYPFQ